MANICETTLKIYRDEAFTKKEIEDIQNFINEKIAYEGTDDSMGDEGDDFLEFYISTKWVIPVEPCQELAKTFKVEVRAIGREDGCGYLGFVKIDDTGKIIKDESLDTA